MSTQAPTIDSLRNRIATLTAQQQQAAESVANAEDALKQQGWDPSTETPEQFVARLQQIAATKAAAADAAAVELDTLLRKYEGGNV